MSLNELLTTFCDTTYRTVTGVTFSGKAVPYNKYTVQYTCRGCANASRLLGTSRRTRALIPAITDRGGDQDESERLLPEVNGEFVIVMSTPSVLGNQLGLRVCWNLEVPESS